MHYKGYSLFILFILQKTCLKQFLTHLYLIGCRCRFRYLHREQKSAFVTFCLTLKLPCVVAVRQCFAVLEDGALAHNLQEQESKYNVAAAHHTSVQSFVLCGLLSSLRQSLPLRFGDLICSYPPTEKHPTILFSSIYCNLFTHNKGLLFVARRFFFIAHFESVLTFFFFFLALLQLSNTTRPTSTRTSWCRTTSVLLKGCKMRRKRSRPSRAPSTDSPPGDCG